VTAVQATEARALPFRKWNGGKRQLLEQLRPLLPSSFGDYHEPFLGMGALFYDVVSADPHRHHVLSDINPEIIGAYQAIRRDVDGVIAALRQHRNDKEHYLAVRAWKPEDLPPNEAAARFIFLGKCGFNGLYRVNQKGRFNVSFGDYANPTICDVENLRRVSRVLQRARLFCGAYDSYCGLPISGALAYFDPPYLPMSETASFTAYGADAWGEPEHRKLAAYCQRLDGLGVKWMLSNSDTPETHAIYGSFGWDIQRVSARRNINRDGGKRGPVSELVIRNYR